MPIPIPLSALLNQGAVFRHKELEFSSKPRIKYLVYLNSKIHPDPLFFVLTTTDKKRKIPTLKQARQDDILVIPPGKLDFFKSDDHTFIDLNNFRDIDKVGFEKDFNCGKVEYVGILSSEQIKELLEKTRKSRVLRPEYKKRILGY